MQETYSLKKPESYKSKRRVGRGPSSGNGKTSGRGMNGQMSRSGSKKRAWFEGGQMPLQRRVPKRGFNNIFKKYYQVVNVSTLNDMSENEITPEVLASHGIISSASKPVKVLGSGEIKSSKKVTANAFSASAREKITGAGGEAVIAEQKPAVQE